MLFFVIGRSGSGKTTYIRNLAASFVKSGSDGVTLIIPEQFSFDTERAMLNNLGEAAFSDLNIVSFTRMAEKLLKQTQSRQKPFVSEAARALLMNNAISDLSDELTICRKHNKSPTMLSNLLFIDEELKICVLNPSDLEKTAALLPDGTLKIKAEEYSKILALYNAKLEMKYEDGRDILKRCADYLKENNPFENKFVLIDAFRGFTAVEYEILEFIMKQATAVYISISAEFLYDADNGAGVFSHTVRGLNRLTEIAHKNNIPIAKPLYLSGNPGYNNFPLDIKHFNSPELFALERMIYNEEAEIYSQNAENITVYAAANKYDECDFAASTAKRLIREKGWRCRDIAIIERVAGKYRAELVSALKKYDLPAFEDNRRSVAGEALMAFVASSLEIAAKGFSTESILRCFKTGLTNISIEEISVVENYTLIWRIDGARWKKEWKFHPGGYGNEFKERDYKLLEEINKIRDKMILPLLDFKDSLKESNIEEACRAIYDYLCVSKTPERLRILAQSYADSGNAALAEDCVKTWDILMEMLDTLVEVSGVGVVDAAKMYELFNMICAVSDVGNIPQGLDEITIGSAERIRICAPKAVFLVGMNVDEFPLLPNVNVAFSNRERGILKENGFELSDTNEQKAVEERHITYSVMSLAKEKLFISYSTAQNALPSEIPEFIYKYFPQANKISHENTNPLERIESKSSAFEASALMYNSNEALSMALKDYFNATAEYSGQFVAIKRIAEKEVFEIEDKEIARRLFGENIKLSASRIENYNACPFSYFCKFGIRAYPIKSTALDNLQGGNIIHYIFEQLFSQYTISEYKKIKNEEQNLLIQSFINEYADTMMGGYDNLPKRTLFLLNSYALTARIIMDRLIYEFDNSKFEIQAVEMQIGGGGKIPEYRVSLDDGSQVLLGGYVDRFDTMKNGDSTYFRIIDYKGGGKNLSLTEVFSGINLQMLIYLIAIWENGKDAFGDLTPAAVLYVPAKLGDISLDRHSDEKKSEKEKRVQGKMSGLVLDDETVFEGMGGDENADMIPGLKSDKRSRAASCISLSALKLLRKIVDEKIYDTAMCMKNGKIPVKPIKNGDKLPCTYCDYNVVCSYEDGDDCNEALKASNSEILKNLEEEAADNGGA